MLYSVHAPPCALHDDHFIDHPPMLKNIHWSHSLWLECTGPNGFTCMLSFRQCLCGPLLSVFHVLSVSILVVYLLGLWYEAYLKDVLLVFLRAFLGGHERCAEERKKCE